MIFINLPVQDLPRADAFYLAIGATKNPIFSDETASCMVLSETIHVMLLTHPKYQQFTRKPIADTHALSAALLCLSLDSRAEVDALVAAGAAAGGKADPSPPQDHGFMLNRSLEDPDGHTWELLHMDMAAAQAAMGKG